MSRSIKTLGSTLIIDTRIKSVLRDHKWITIPPMEWDFLIMISGSDWMTGNTSARERTLARRLRARIGTRYVENVRGHGYRLGVR